MAENFKFWVALKAQQSDMYETAVGDHEVYVATADTNKKHVEFFASERRKQGEFILVTAIELDMQETPLWNLIMKPHKITVSVTYEGKSTEVNIDLDHKTMTGLNSNE